MKKYSDQMKWKEDSKLRKLKSQIRSRKMQENSRKKLMSSYQDSRNGSGQLQTDYFHNSSGKILTRKQVDTFKQKIIKGSGDGNERGRNREQQRMEREKQDRSKRLEKRMMIKERGGGYGRRGQDHDSEEDD